MAITREFGCERITPSYPKRLQRFLNRFELTNILQVPRRKKGMTSSGTPHQCHQNVNKLVNTIGGSALRGWWLTENNLKNGLPIEEIKYLSLTYHSVWITPEGKATDVTMREWDDTYEPWFIPLYKTNDRTIKFWMDIIVTETWKRDGLQIDTIDYRDMGYSIGDNIPIGKWKNLVKLTGGSLPPSDGFSEPSIVSKMSFDDFEELYKNQREFGGFGEKKPPRITDAVRQIKD